MSHRTPRLVAVGLCAGLVCMTGCPDSGIDPGQFRSCDSLQEHAAVQQALTILAQGGQSFTFFSGSNPANLLGTWDTTASRITHTQDGPAGEDLPTGRMEFTSSPPGNTISWAATQGSDLGASSLRAFISGTSASATACIFAQVQRGDLITGVFTCRTQNAIFFSLTPSSDGQTATGQFLNVVLARLSGAASCGDPGDFSFGTISLKRVDLSIPVLTGIGHIDVGVAQPTGVVIDPSGSFGFVGTSGGNVLRFDVNTRQISSLSLPQPNGFLSIGPLGMSRPGSDVGFVTEGDSRVLSFNALGGGFIEAHVLPPQTPSPGTFLPIAPLYNAVASRGYVGVAFQNNRPAVAVFNAAAGSGQTGVISTAMFLQDGLSSMVLSPNTSQIAAVLRGAAAAGRARFLGLVNVSTDAPSVTREIDLGSQRMLDFLDEPAVYSIGGELLFLTNGPELLAVQTSGSFGVAAFEVRDGTSDVVRHRAVSADGDVLAVTVATSGSNNNLVLLDPGTMGIFRRAREPGAAFGPTGGHAAFVGDTRVLVIEDGAGHVTPIDTAPPFRAGVTRDAFGSASTSTIAAMAVGGRVVAVANRAERRVYLFRLTNP